MALIVQKYGGTSVGTGADSSCRQTGNSDRESRKFGGDGGYPAMGKSTDGLVKLVNEISGKSVAGEMDMLLATGEQVSMALVSVYVYVCGASGGRTARNFPYTPQEPEGPVCHRS
jgi:aspartate kinase